LRIGHVSVLSQIHRRHLDRDHFTTEASESAGGGDLSEIKLQKRRNDFFVSYGHGDLALVMPLVNLLRRVCGLQIWFDGAEGNAAMRSSELLAGAVGNSRGSIFCLSEAWKRSTWCKNEYELSLSEQRQHDGFESVSLRIDDVKAPDWFNVAEIVDLRQVEARSIARLLRSLSTYLPNRFDNAEDFYLAAPWSQKSQLQLEILESLPQMGWRLVGDSPNVKHFRDSLAWISTARNPPNAGVA
jgi:TIR domain